MMLFADVLNMYYEISLKHNIRGLTVEEGTGPFTVFTLTHWVLLRIVRMKVFKWK